MHQYTIQYAVEAHLTTTLTLPEGLSIEQVADALGHRITQLGRLFHTQYADGEVTLVESHVTAVADQEGWRLREQPPVTGESAEVYRSLDLSVVLKSPQ